LSETLARMTHSSFGEYIAARALRRDHPSSTKAESRFSSYRIEPPDRVKAWGECGRLTPSREQRLFRARHGIRQRWRERCRSSDQLDRFKERLCCKKHSVGETEPTANLCGRLFSFQSEDFPDELNLHKGIPFRQPPSLGLSGSCAEPRSLESSVKLHRTIEILDWQRKRKL